jgi:two-component system, sensor histidine kinase and response regulator
VGELRPLVRRILLVEDHPVSQRVATVMLENLGFHVDVAADGAHAVRAAISTPYHAVLMDCQIPVIDGYQATVAIRHLQGAARRTPIVAVTASDAPSDRQRGLTAGFDDYLTKPFTLQALGAVLARWVGDGSGPTCDAESPGTRTATRAEPAGRAGRNARAAANRPVLDAVVVERLERMGKAAGEDLMGQLTALFLADADARISAAREALAIDDAAEVARSAHALSGAGANLGAAGLAHLCATLATSGAAGDLADAGALLEAVEVELGRVRSALRSFAPAS